MDEHLGLQFFNTQFRGVVEGTLPLIGSLVGSHLVLLVAQGELGCFDFGRAIKALFVILCPASSWSHLVHIGVPLHLSIEHEVACGWPTFLLRLLEQIVG